ncbi:MAG: hypothetical protein KC553_12310, partial [Nitrospina sp.]|nr:hypothetical protein [Nitrospina sp.]
MKVLSLFLRLENLLIFLAVANLLVGCSHKIDQLNYGYNVSSKEKACPIAVYYKYQEIPADLIPIGEIKLG